MDKKILIHHLQFLNVFCKEGIAARCIPYDLSYQHKKVRVRTCTELLLSRFGREGVEFLDQIITGDESDVYYFGHDSKRKSMEYHHTSSHPPTKAKAAPTLGKLLLIYFWDSKRLVHHEFLPSKVQINSAI